VDFYLPEQGQLIQVTSNIAQSTTRDQEVRALRDAIGTVKVQSAIILSDSNKKPFEINGIPAHIQSTAEWLLAD
jgi:hypothetical protein